MKVHDDLTFNVIGATMAYYDLTFKVIGATVESPSQTPLLAYINQKCVAIKQNCLEGTPAALECFLLGRGAGLAARRLISPHLPSGPLGFAEGSSTASVFLRSAPPPLTPSHERM